MSNSPEPKPIVVPVTAFKDKEKPEDMKDPVARGKAILKALKEENSPEKRAALSSYVAQEADNLHLQGLLSKETLDRIRDQDRAAVRAVLVNNDWHSPLPSLRDRLSKIFKLPGINYRKGGICPRKT